MGPLRITLLGGFEIRTGAGEPVSLPSRNAQAILAFLAMSAGRAQARDKLATLLWGGSGTDHARASLRQTLSVLRRSVNAEALRGDGDTVVLDPCAVAVDAVRFERLLGVGTAAALEEASGLYHGSFLDGFGPLADPFEAWLMTERMRLHELAENGLTRLLEHYQRERATEAATRVAHRLLTLDPLQERVHRLLMQLYVERGRPRSALKQYETLCELLQRELGVTPDAETRKLAAKLHAEQPAATAEGSVRLSRPLAGTGPLPPVAGPAGQDFARVGAEEADRRMAPAEAERRFVTLMECALAEAAVLSRRLDPEELRTVVAGFADCCERLVCRYGGRVSHIAENSLTACFGSPWADEHDAERAVRSGLEIVAAVERLSLLPDVAMHARIGIASGEVVIGGLAHDDGATEEVVTGEAPYVAAGLQATAAPGSVLVAGRTKRLLGSLFDCQDLGDQSLQGIDAPVHIWRVLGKRSGQSRFEATRAISPLAPLVGREAEMDLLMRCWEQAKAGSGQVVVLAGEPGIGKSRLIHELRERLGGEAYTHFGYYCSPHHQERALYPVIQELARAAGYARGDPPASKLEKLEALLAEAPGDLPGAVPFIAGLLAIPTGDRYSASSLTPQRQKETTLEILEARLVGLTRATPGLMIFEDLHWSDSTTREALDRLVERVQSLPVLMIVTHRPGTPMPRTGEPHVTSLVLKRLRRGETEALLANLTGERRLPEETLARIVDRADGVPLFVEALAKNALEAAVPGDRGDGRTPGVPDTLYGLLRARLDRLGPAKRLAQQAAVIGRKFTYALLAAVVPVEEPELGDSLARLTDAELVYARGTPPDASYSFRHPLVRDAACASMLRADRALLHARIAKVLEERFPETKDVEPELLAHHLTEAGLPGRACFYWQSAGERALRRSAQREAIDCFDKALESLSALPRTAERSGLESRLKLLRGQARGPSAA